MHTVASSARVSSQGLGGWDHVARDHNVFMSRISTGWLVAGSAGAGAMLDHLGWTWAAAGALLVMLAAPLLPARGASTVQHSHPTGHTDPKRQDALNRTIGQNEDIALAAQDLTDFVTLIAEITQESETAASRVREAGRHVADSATSVATATEELSAAMNEVARSATQATRVTSQVDGQAAGVRETAQRLVASMGQIDDMVKTIAMISAQTKLLALNATIEAARAGSSGKGFAVVAEEVKQLSTQTDEATQTIARQLNGLVTESQTVLTSVEEIANAFKDMDTLQQSASAAVEEQSSAIAQISQSAQQSAAAANDLDAAASTTADLVQRTNGATRGAHDRMNRLTATVGDQNVLVASLLDGPRHVHPVRAAVSAHAQWKQRLRTAVNSGRVDKDTDPATVTRDDACDFGRWLHGEAQALADPAQLRRVVDAHATFHREAAGVLAAVANGDLDQAKHRLVDNNDYAGAEAALTDLLISWTRDLNVY
jgi:predicted HAD superfamily Cof-like phosphohydrolase